MYRSLLLLLCGMCYLREDVPLERAGLGRALLMVVSLQASGNLVNSYIDHNYGVDTLETAGDRCEVVDFEHQRYALFKMPMSCFKD